MTTTAVRAGSGNVQVHVDTTGLGAWQKLGMIKSVQKPTATVDEIDATDMDSTAKEFIAGLADFGECPITLNWNPGDTTDAYIETWRAGGNENRQVRITTPNNKTYIFPGFIKSYGGQMQVGQLLEGSLTIRCAGDITRNF